MDKHRGDWKGLLSLFRLNHVFFDEVSWATTAILLGKIRGDDKIAMRNSAEYRAFMLDLCREMTASPDLREFGKAQSIAKILKALAELKEENEGVAKLLVAVEKNSGWLVQKGSPQDISSIAWALATYGFPAPTLFKKIDERASFLVEHGSPSAIFHAAWAFVAFNISAPALFNELVDNGTPEKIDFTMQAFASLNMSAPALVEKVRIRSELFEKLQDHMPVDMVVKWETVKRGSANLNVYWRSVMANCTADHDSFDAADWVSALHRLGGRSFEDKISISKHVNFGGLLHNLALRMTHSTELSSFGSVEDVASIVLAIANIVVSPSDDVMNILGAVSKNSAWLVENGKAHDIAKVVRAFTLLAFPDPALFEKIEERSASFFATAGPWDIGATATGFVKLPNNLDMQSSSFFDNIKERSFDIVENGTPGAISSTAWAFASLNLPATALFEKIDKHAAVIVRTGSFREISMLAWACAVLQTPSDCPRALFLEIEKHAQSMMLKAECPRQKKNLAWSLAWSFQKFGLSVPGSFVEFTPDRFTPIEESPLKETSENMKKAKEDEG
jgi:hypothetical protein